MPLTPLFPCLGPSVLGSPLCSFALVHPFMSTPRSLIYIYIYVYISLSVSVSLSLSLSFSLSLSLSFSLSLFR